MKSNLLKLLVTTIISFQSFGVCYDVYDKMLDKLMKHSSGMYRHHETGKLIFDQRAAVEKSALATFVAAGLFGTGVAEVVLTATLIDSAADNINASRLEDTMDLIKNIEEETEESKFRRPLYRLVEVTRLMGARNASTQEITSIVKEMNESGSLCDGSIFKKTKKINRNGGKIKRKKVVANKVPSRYKLARYINKKLKEKAQ